MTTAFDRAMLMHGFVCGGLFWPVNKVPTCRKCGARIMRRGDDTNQLAARQAVGPVAVLE